MRLVIVWALIIVAGLTVAGCSPAEPLTQDTMPEASDPAVEESSGQTIDAPKTPPVPWGGMEVTTTGSELAEASDVVVLLHGYGSSRSDLVPIASSIGGPSRGYVFPDAPVTLPGGGKAWATTESELAESQRKIADLVNYLHSVNEDARIFVGGFSQGATMASTLLTDPDLPVRGVVLYSPSLVLTKFDLPSEVRPAVFLSHARDDEVLPFSDSQQLRDVLQAQSANVQWHPFVGGHTITDELIEATREWLERSSTPSL